MKRLGAFVAWVLAISSCIAGCGGGDDSSGHCSTTESPALDATEKLAVLTTAQKTTLCDWGACYLGGYGATLSCSNGPAATVTHDQQACLQSISVPSSCEATVQDQIDCLKAIHESPCSTTFFSNDACARLIDCVL